MASEPYWAKTKQNTKATKQNKPVKAPSWWKIFVGFFQHKLRKALFSVSLFFLLKKWGKEKKSWKMKRKRKKQMGSLEVGGDFCHGKSCNIPLTGKSTYPAGGLHACPAWVGEQTSCLSLVGRCGGSTLSQLQNPPAIVT